MKENIFELANQELKTIADNLQEKIEFGLKKDGTEILAIPTYINPKEEMEDGRVLALDWGGTNFRAAIVELAKGREPVIVEAKKKLLSAKETIGFSRNDLLEEMADLISSLEYLDNRITRIGYCFSYPAESLYDGDATLLRWTKGIDIPEMIGILVGKSLVDYLNNHKGIDTTFTHIKVINDTVACLFAGLADVGHDAYIGLIVGTGTNMAALMHMNKIEKLNNKGPGFVPVNLESGNFNPPYLTIIDRLVDSMSGNQRSQRFEKAISGGYLGEIFKTVFSMRKIKYDFDGADLSNIINNPEDSPEEYVNVANWIYTRSAQLVSASLAGLIQVLLLQDESIKSVCLAATGGVFWSNDYCRLVSGKLKELLPEGIQVKIAEKEKMEEANLVGSAIAAMS
ncbi:MAG: hexokinase [Tannerella sp.]|jgi:hexokinase|nr:hexokinase [Tannerella sp.]